MDNNIENMEGEIFNEMEVRASALLAKMEMKMEDQIDTISLMQSFGVGEIAEGIDGKYFLTVDIAKGNETILPELLKSGNRPEKHWWMQHMQKGISPARCAEIWLGKAVAKEAEEKPEVGIVVTCPCEQMEGGGESNIITPSKPNPPRDLTPAAITVTS
jgi:hypothetical protein